MLRRAVSLSRSMQAMAERGEIGDLVVRMHERDLLLAKLPGLLASLKESGNGKGTTGDVWTDVLSGLRDFGRENTLLIEALRLRRKAIVRDIAEAEGHRRLSAYAV